MYLERFVLPIEQEDNLIQKRKIHNGGERFGYIDNVYPCGIFSQKKLSEVNFDKITIFYGGNGSGKSTLLNLIASKLELNRIAPINSSELFDSYARLCKYELGYDEEGFRHRIPNGSRIISSDDIFDYMLTVRTSNQDREEHVEEARDLWYQLRTGSTIKFSGLDDYEALRTQNLARSKTVSRRQFIQRTVGKEVKLNSNGETALKYFDTKIKNNTLYCLDEPENSLSPKLQIELAKFLEKAARYCDCQFIIATHSPFLLAMEGARIYDLDETPVDIKNWWELENTKTYFGFFEKHRHLFE